MALDLAIEACGDPAIQVPVWKAAWLHKEVKANEYEQRRDSLGRQADRKNSRDR